MKRFTLILLSVLILPTFLGNHNIYSSNVTINNSGNRTNLTAVENANEQEIANSNNDVFYEDEKIAVTSLTAGDFTVDGPSNGFSYASNVLTISSAGTYTISGVTITDIIVITASAEVILNNVDIKTSTRAPLEVQGNNAENASDNITATIKLKGENTLTPTGLNYAGLQLSNGANLILENGAAESETVGSLTVTSGEHGAGIGSGYIGTAGNITISGGTVTATGGDAAAGIGSGCYGTAGNITISGGTVTATGGKYAAGIGSGYGMVASNLNITYKSTAGNILISGGKVTIKAGDRAAGIGSGWWGIIGNITISGGEINVETSNADSYGNGAGIGAGRVGLAGNIEITDGTIKATGNNYGVGIGAGAYATVENIMISGGTVTASGGTYGAGIGSGYSNTTDNSNIKTITISGGTVTATGGNHGAGIGSGYSTTAGGSKIETITISGGTVTAKAGASAVGIGKGNGNNSTCTSVQITGGSVKAMDSSGTVNSISPAPTSDGKTSVYLGILENQAGVQSIIVDNVDYKVAGNHPNDSSLYLYMTGTNHIIDGDGWYYASYGDKNFTISDSDTVDLRVYNQEGQLAIDVFGYYASNVLIINATDAEKIYTVKLRNGITQTSDRIVIKTNATIILENVNINTSAGTPLEVQGNSAAIKLKGENILTTTGENYAGLQLSNGANLNLENGAAESETIGSLTATGGYRGAGIGSGNSGIAGNITISGGTVTATGGTYGAGIGAGENGTAGNITISGGTVTATSEMYGSGIGSGYSNGTGSLKVETITISGGTVTATGGKYGSGIGSGYGATAGDITISGGTVTAKAGKSAVGIGKGSVGSCTGVQITGGSVKAMDSSGTVNSISPAPTSDGKTSVYLGILENQAGVQSIIVDNVDYKVAGNHPDGDNNFYLYMTGTNHAIAGNSWYTASYDSSSNNFTFNIKDLEVRNEEGNLAADVCSYESDVVTISATDAEKIYTVKLRNGITQTSDRIVINTNATIILENVNINTSAGTPLEVQGNSATNASDNVTATIKLKGENILTTTNINCAGLQLSSGANLILENGAAESETVGSLTATGGGTTSKGGAGIGSGSAGAAGNIDIKSGNIKATGGYDSAGIGTGGSKAKAGKITINGGTVAATGGDYAPGIGAGSRGSISDIGISDGNIIANGGITSAGIGSSGFEASCGSITISGGKITATGGNETSGTKGGSGIGAGGFRTTTVETITISGGTVTAKAGNSAVGIGKGSTGSCTGVQITGGSVKAMDNEGNVDSISPTPTSDGTNRVYLVTLPDQSNVKEVTVSKYTVKETTVDEETGTNWGISSNHPDDTSLYLYFPEQHHKIIVNSTASSELTYYAKWLPTNKFMIMTNSTYLVTIPNTVKFTDDATATEEFTIRDVELIPPDIKKDVKVSISDINRMILTRENDPDSENPATAKFAIYKGNTTDTALKGGDTVVTAKDSGESNTETTQSVTIGVVGNQYVKAGKYTGSLTFTISLVRTMASN